MPLSAIGSPVRKMCSPSRILLVPDCTRNGDVFLCPAVHEPQFYCTCSEQRFGSQHHYQSHFGQLTNQVFRCEKEVQYGALRYRPCNLPNMTPVRISA